MLVSMGMFNLGIGVGGGASSGGSGGGFVGAILNNMGPALAAAGGANPTANRIPIPVTPPPTSATPGTPPLYVAPPAAALISTAPAPTPGSPTPAASGGLSVAGHAVPWVYVGLGVGVLGLGAFLLLRRR